MSDLKHVTVSELKQRLTENPELLVVNTYMMEAGFNATRIEPAIPMYVFTELKDGLDRDREIVFY
ncbi:hypothetical protein KDL44_05450 [bacterium]|nr:hypothetical protein [bacterium]